MIVTVKTPSRGHAVSGQFEAIKFGLECERTADNCLTITTGQVWRAVALAERVNGEVIAVVDRMYNGE